MPLDLGPFPRSRWSPLPREGCKGVLGKVLLVRAEVALAMLSFAPEAAIDEHAADHEVEVVCLEGEGRVSVGGEEAPLREGQRVRWPAGIAHRLWTVGRPMTMLMIELFTGASSDASELRLQEIGSDADDLEALQRVLEGSPEYFQRATGQSAGPAEAQSLLWALPDGKGREDKFLWGIYRGTEMIGCADVIRGHPDPGRAVLGLLLLVPRHMGKGLGRRAHALVEEEVSQWAGIRTIRLAVVRTNEGVLGFWERMGYVRTGEVQPYCHGGVRSELVVMEKPLPSLRARASPRVG